MGINRTRMRTKWNLLAFLTVCAAGAILGTPRSAMATVPPVYCCYSGDGLARCCGHTCYAGGTYCHAE
jgi:hypothetical protein